MHAPRASHAFSVLCCSKKWTATPTPAQTQTQWRVAVSLSADENNHWERILEGGRAQHVLNPKMQMTFKRDCWLGPGGMRGLTWAHYGLRVLHIKRRHVANGEAVPRVHVWQRNRLVHNTCSRQTSRRVRPACKPTRTSTKQKLQHVSCV